MTDLQINLTFEEKVDVEEDQTLEDVKEDLRKYLVRTTGIEGVEVSIKELVDGLESHEKESEVYVIEDHNQTVSTAKSQFAEEYEIDYSEVAGKIIDPGYGASYPRLAVVTQKYE